MPLFDQAEVDYPLHDYVVFLRRVGLGRRARLPLLPNEQPQVVASHLLEAARETQMEVQIVSATRQALTFTTGKNPPGSGA